MSYSEVYSAPGATPPNCCFGLELTREASVYPDAVRSQGYRLKVTVTRATGCSPNIFLHSVRGPDALSAEQYLRFEAVCRPVDFEEFPAGLPEDMTGVLNVRLAEIDLLFASRAELEEVWAALLADRDELLRTFGTLCSLEVDDVSAEGTFLISSSSSAPDPEYPEPVSSSSSGCPTDNYVGLIVTDSNDPELPVDTVIELGPVQGGTCHRDGVVTLGDLTLAVSVYPTDNRIVFSVEHVAKGDDVDTAGLAFGYAAIMNYSYATTGQDYSVRVQGITELPSS